jgi:hypothetical protein
LTDAKDRTLAKDRTIAHESQIQEYSDIPFKLSLSGRIISPTVIKAGGLFIKKIISPNPPATNANFWLLSDP